MSKRATWIAALFLLAAAGSLYYYEREFAAPKRMPALLPERVAVESLAYFAGGCFWCTEADFEKIPGVSAAISGYAGGHLEHPSYTEVVTETTGHRESVEVRYDPSRVTYRALVEYFFAHIDPEDGGGQFVDRGESYTSAIFFQNADEERIARDVVSELTRSGAYQKPIVTLILPFANFYPAEEYHQDYYKKNPLRYEYYRSRSGRDDRIAELCARRGTSGLSCGLPAKGATTSISKHWEMFVKPADAALGTTLSPLAYRVTQEDDTEPAFRNAYWDNAEEGIYVDVVSGEPLFSSLDKYDSGTGWPSFTKPISPDAVKTREDRSLFATRIEVRSAIADSHLGHVFDDGPLPLGKRWCMNSAALRFVPRSRLGEEGYGEYGSLWEERAE